MENLKIIGHVESCYLDKFGTPRQSGLVADSSARIILKPEFQPESSLQGLEEFSHLWIIFLFHKNTNHRFHAKVHPPRLLGESKGVFATRSPHRPNPIGLSLVKLEKIESGIIYIKEIDLIDGTPVLDIKPYLPNLESIPEAKAGWAANTKVLEIEVHFADEVEKELKSYENKHPEKNFRKLIQDTLKLDPRPVVYRGFEKEKNSPYRSQHAVRIIDYDIHFEFLSSTEILVQKINLL